VTAAATIGYPSDLSDDEWKLVEPLQARGGDKRTLIMREIVNGLIYILSTGCQWRAIPKTCRRARRCTIISICEVGIARSISHIISSM
jgi:transposase